ncbi:MAG: 4Fe-4S dicluster domain-containing protein [Candidatus Krumholzibacteriota bacterium]|nr:4Fe-4S dicluster domain-containing protein [Candidatus Krumholzibacteriota bacterium]
MLDKEVVYEATLDHDFLDEIYSLPGGQEIKKCIQCGTCSGSCPQGAVMDHAPRKIFSLIRAGFRNEVLESNTIWLCSSCYSCSVRCPKEIKITDVMYALKRLAIKEGKAKRGRKASILSKNFVRLVNKYGRNHETELMTRYIVQAELFNALNFVPQGMKLFTNGRLPLFPHKIKNIEQLRKILKKVDELGGI